MKKYFNNKTKNYFTGLIFLLILFFGIFGLSPQQFKPMLARTKIILLALFLLIGVGMYAKSSEAATVPALNFSDIISGPKTGNTDGVGSGAIVTIWGNYLGSTQGTSKVYVGNVEATAIYYWKDADGTLPGGPADLYTYHKMQEIAFAIPAGAVNGANTIKVTVGGANSNTLPFTVRTGNIKFIKSTGSDSTGIGTWTDPYQTLQSTFDGGNGKVAAGDIVYSVGVGSTAGLMIGHVAGIIGTAANPVALIAYPNTSLAISRDGQGDNEYTVISHYYVTSRGTQYIHHSKHKVRTYGNYGNPAGGSPYGFSVGNYARIIGTEIYGPNTFSGYGGAVTYNYWGYGAGTMMYGLYIHNYGYANTWAFIDDYTKWGPGTTEANCVETAPGDYNGIAGVNCTNCKCVDGYNHLFYLSNRAAGRIQAYEIGWGYFADNPMLQGLHIYDQTPGGGWSGTLKLFNNVIKNQRANSINTGFPISSNIDIFNNIIISDSGDILNGMALSILNPGTNNIFNNTIYGYRNPSDIQVGTSNYRNNLMVDNKGVAFHSSNAPSTHSNNMFYSTHISPPGKPSWATGAGETYANPLFTNAAGYDFSLTSSSPARGVGSDTTLTVAPTDFFGQPRISGSVSMGAIEYSSDGGSGGDTTSPSAPSGLSVN